MTVKRASTVILFSITLLLCYLNMKWIMIVNVLLLPTAHYTLLSVVEDVATMSQEKWSIFLLRDNVVLFRLNHPDVTNISCWPYCTMSIIVNTNALNEMISTMNIT